MAAISLCSWCTGNVHIGRTNQGGVGDVYAPVAMLWGKVLRRKWSSIHYIAGVERNRFSIHQWRNRMLIFCSTSTFSKTCNKIQKQLLKLLYILLSYKVSYSSIEEMGRNMGCLQFGMPVFHLETAIFHSGLRSFQRKELQPLKLEEGRLPKCN